MSLSPYFFDINRPFSLMEPELITPVPEYFGYSPYQLPTRGFLSPQQFFKPWEDMLRSYEGIMQPIEQVSAALNQMAIQDVGSKITADKEKFQVNVDVQHFAPEEVNVKVTDGFIIVQGKHEEKRDEHGYISRQFIRRYALPQGCLQDTVESKLSSDGVLTVTAPRVLPLPSPGETIIPIMHTGPVQKQLGSPSFEPIEESK